MNERLVNDAVYAEKNKREIIKQSERTTATDNQLYLDSKQEPVEGERRQQIFKIMRNRTVL